MSLPLSPSPPPPSPFPQPPGTDAPPTCEVPHFAPVRVGGVRHRLHRFLRRRRLAAAVGLALTAAVLVAAGPRADRARGRPEGGTPVHAPAAAEAGARERRTTEARVSAPVRIADADTVRLLKPGDRVDVIAAAQTASGGGGARVMARAALVTALPESGDGAAGAGALVVLSVPRATAARLVAAGATARLAVTLC
ncbi:MULTISPECIES: hypothetical protein [unclassified Streptomyces]|uniref:hypothetical protein n=1 Tax=unclassified Streptomyces TaxID=2593676 RepID=UPI001F0407EF|nr:MULTISPECIES: hypothetical protein [unclassified Streptomyces]MCH0562217.1 hypothetical protein [Streptomyces sp. MUM 2J]MCH0568140.1 hypothetical protein [Streptomyces sp. MUM 136J]